MKHWTSSEESSIRSTLIVYAHSLSLKFLKLCCTSSFQRLLALLALYRFKVSFFIGCLVWYTMFSVENIGELISQLSWHWLDMNCVTEIRKVGQWVVGVFNDNFEC